MAALKRAALALPIVRDAKLAVAVQEQGLSTVII